MADPQSWNWEPGAKEIADIGAWNEKYEWTEEMQVSPDGENIAAVTNKGDAEFTVCINGEDAWDAAYERIWSLKYSPDGRLAAFAADMGDWSLQVDGKPMSESLGYAWNLQFNTDGSTIAACIQNDMEYGMIVNGALWDNLYENANNFIISPDGKHSAGVVQTAPLGQADIRRYQKGLFSAAVDGDAWDTLFTNVFTLAFSADGTSVAGDVRTTLYDYTIAVDGKAWDTTYQGTWTPTFNPDTGGVVAPVRKAGKWSLALDDYIIWQPFVQCWHQLFSADGKKLAAIVSPTYGRWTMALDGKPWKTTFGDMVVDPVFSADGERLAAIGKDGDKWTIVADDRTWRGKYDMVWKPVFSPNGEHVAAKVDMGGKYTIAVDGKDYSQSCEACWEPIFSPDSKHVLLRCIENGKYIRRVVPVAEILG